VFYEPAKKDHGLPIDPYRSCVVPRPIGWISTVDGSGRINLAPFSQFNNVGLDPPYILFSAGNHRTEHRCKDTVANITATGEFVYNMATFDLREAVVLSARTTESGVDEMAAAGLTPAPSRLVRPPRVAESPIQFECLLHQTIVLPGVDRASTNHLVIGRVVGVHIADSALDATGKVDLARLRPLARLGYAQYASVDRVFEVALPGATIGQN